MRPAFARDSDEPSVQQLDVWSRGGKALPLLMLPGTACDERVFAPSVGRLGHAPILFGDLSGQESAHAAATAVLAVAPDRFALCGFSLGGIVALEMISQAPERIAGLALIGTNPADCAEADIETRRKAAAKAARTDMDSYILDPWSRLVAPSNAGDRRLQDLVLDMARATGPETLARQIEVAVTRADSRPRLSRIAVPTIVLSGEAEQVSPLDLTREILDYLPDAEMHLIPAAGHFAPLENPPAIAAHLRRWLDTVLGAESRANAK